MKSLLEGQIDRELKKLDPDLYLDKHWFEGNLFWSVRYAQAPGVEPLFVVTSPELSWEMVTQVRLNEGDITDAISKVKANNIAQKEMARQETAKKMEEAAIEHDASIGKIRRWYIPGVKPV